MFGKQQKQLISFFKSKKVFFTPFTIFVLLLVSIFIISLVKHQKISLHKQLIRVEIIGQDWTENYDQQRRYKPPYWLVENLEIGAQELSPDGRVVSEIINIEYFEGAKNNFQVFLIVEFEAVDSFSSGRVTYKGKNIEVGEEIEFHFNNSLVVGQVTDTNYLKKNQESEELLVTGIYRNISLFAAETIKVEDKIINPFNGDIYATVFAKRIYPSSDSILYESDGSVLRFRDDYSLRNIELDIKIVAEKHLGEYYFGGNQVVRIGEEVSLVFPGVQLGLMEITNVSKVSDFK